MKHFRQTAFTLMELLIVLAIMAALIAIAIPSIRGLSKGQSITNTVTLLTGILNNAKQEAVTKNTYVYVAMGTLDNNVNPATTADQDPTLWIACFSSNDGTNSDATNPSIDWASMTASLPNSKQQLIGAPRAFKHILLKDQGELSVSSLTSTSDPNIDSPANCNITINTGGKNLRLNRLIVFTPTGQTMVKNDELFQSIEFGIVGTQDSGTQPKDPAVFRVSGNLGVITVYRN